MIHLVTGKGGVGKSTIAAALAYSLARQGRKTLLVELGERSYYRHLFAQDVSGQPSPLAEFAQLSVARWEGEACLREYLLHLLKIERVVRLFFDNKVMKALVQAAPALKELALLGKITSGPRAVGPNLPFDEVVVDAYATGHFRALWRAPVGLAEAIPFGPMGEQSRSIVDVMKNAKLTKIYVVMIPEEWTTHEGVELASDIKKELNQEPHLILNRFLELPFPDSELTSVQDHDFTKYLMTLIRRQKSSEDFIKSAGFTFQRLPWFISATPLEKVVQLSQRFFKTGHETGQVKE